MTTPERSDCKIDRPFSRRTALAGLAAAGAAGVLGVTRPAHAALLRADELGYDESTGQYTLPALPYAYDALEPVIDETTMRIHHTKHHQGYINGLNTALAKLAEIRDGAGDAGLIKHWSRELSFHGSGHVNHAMFWSSMAPASEGGGEAPEGPLMRVIHRDFGNFEKFKAHFAAASKSVEGSGWGWLVWDSMAGKLMVLQGEKQQDMMMTGVVPLLGIDVWEHAYYLNYQNRRGDYVGRWFEIVNWKRVNERFQAAMG